MFLTDYIKKHTKCRLGITKNNFSPPLIFGDGNEKIIWIKEYNMKHYEAVLEWNA
jgi:hypothetical protein